MIAIKKVFSKGKLYAYVRGTDIALVRGFVGTRHQFEVAIAHAIRDRGIEWKSTADGFRIDTAKIMHRGAMSRAREFGRSYTLSAEIIAEMLMEARDRCELTDIPFDYSKNDDGSIRPMAPSLDRIDSGLGYDRSNVRVVCTCVNMALNVWGVENFERVCRAFLAKMENGRMQNGKQSSERTINSINNNNIITILSDKGGC